MYEKPREYQIQYEQQHVFEEKVRAAGDQRSEDFLFQLSVAIASESRIRQLFLVA